MSLRCTLQSSWPVDDRFSNAVGQDVRTHRVQKAPTFVVTKYGRDFADRGGHDWHTETHGFEQRDRGSLRS